MRRVTELYVRTDWGIVRFVYLPVVAAGLTMSKWLPFLTLLTLRINPCFLCALVSRWGHHVEEFYNAKPLLRITDRGLRHEDGGKAIDYDWADIVGIVVFRRNYTPPWKTDGSVSITPPYWLEIAVRGGRGERVDEGYVERSRYLESGEEVLASSRPIEQSEPGIDSYIDRSAYSHNARKAEQPTADNVEALCIWPRQVEGGLFTLMRFAREVQKQLIERAHSGHIENLLLKDTGPKVSLKVRG